MSTHYVSGMTCGHCVSAVTEEIMAIVGSTGVHVDLVAGGISTVTVNGNVTDEQIAAAIDEAGYTLARSETIQ